MHSAKSSGKVLICVTILFKKKNALKIMKSLALDLHTEFKVMFEKKLK